jgi:hypothetical protein
MHVAITVRQQDAGGGRMFGKKTPVCSACGVEVEKEDRVDNKVFCRECAFAYLSSKYDMSIEQKKKILVNLIGSAGKYSKPFTKGDLALVNVLGGDWNDYAQVVMNIIISDTLLSIEQTLRRIEGKLEA